MNSFVCLRLVSRNNQSQSLSLSRCLSLPSCAWPFGIVIIIIIITTTYAFCCCLGFYAAPAARQEIQFTAPKCENNNETTTTRKMLQTKTKTKDKQFREWNLKASQHRHGHGQSTGSSRREGEGGGDRFHKYFSKPHDGSLGKFAMSIDNICF